MTDSAFERLRLASESPARLYEVYEGVLKDLFQNPFWQKGATTLHRVRWTDGQRARSEDTATFGLSGVYLWGVEERPLYVGITRKTFASRFSRYIWSDKSQCKLAQKYEKSLRDRGVQGFPREITTWYAKDYRGSTVRLVGAVRFAKEGINDIWFALFPAPGPSPEIRKLEQGLVNRDSGVAVRWNRENELCALLNVQN